MIEHWLGNRFLPARLFVVLMVGSAVAQAGSALAQTTPTINSLLPSSATAGGSGFTLTVSGTGFVPESKVLWDGEQRTTSYFSAITLEAQITSADIDTPGDVHVTVVNPGPTTSTAFVFHVNAGEMKITSISPSTVTAGGAGFTLTVSGTGFTPTSEVYWDDENRDTTFVSSTTLTAAIPASDIVEEGSVPIKVVDSAPGGETSNEVTLSIVSSGLFFPQIVAGGGYSTVFTIFNTSDQDVVCNLILTDEAGNPFTANLTSVTAGAYSPGGDDRIETINPFLAFNLRWGGTKIITMNPVNSGDPAKVGWATVSVNGAKVYGVATYKQTIAGILTTSIGVLSTPPVSYATIPVDNDSSQGRYTGFAIANPGSTNIYIKVVSVDQNGLPDSGVQPAKLNPIGPNEQVAIFLHELIPSRANFKGTVILRVLNNKQAVITALVQDHGIFSAIPVVADKISSVP